MITRVNLPAAQLQVAMGIPLDNIPDIRELYGRNRFEETPDAPEARIDLATAERVKPAGHCMAVRYVKFGYWWQRTRCSRHYFRPASRPRMQKLGSNQHQEGSKN